MNKPDLVTRLESRAQLGWGFFACTDITADGDVLSLWDDPDSDMTVETDASGHVVRFCGIAIARIRPDLKRIDVPTDIDLDGDTHEHLLCDQVLPRALSLTTPLVLHAGGCVIDGIAALVLARSGSGKSTLSAQFAKSGMQLLSDDAIILREGPNGPEVTETYHGLRLLPDSMDALHAGADTATLADYTNKRRLRMIETAKGVWHPLGAVFFLMPPENDTIAASPLPARDVCMRLVENSFAADPTDRREGARRMAAAATVAGNISGYGLHYPRRYDLLPDVVAAVRDVVLG